MDLTGEASRTSAFITLGTLTTAQQIAGAVLSVIGRAESDVVAEETLVLVSVNAARAAAVGLRDRPGIMVAVVETVLDVPFLYHDYLVGENLMGSDLVGSEPDDVILSRLGRLREFYAAHIPANTFPSERTLDEKLELWMGRIAPKRTGIHPSERLKQVDARERLALHNKIVLAFCRQTRAAGAG